MASFNGFNTEGIPKIKLEADQNSTIGDEDDYEDTGELQFPKTPNKAWLVRTPKDLWTGLEDLKNFEEKIPLGQLHVWHLPGGKSKVRWKMNKDIPGFDLIAKEYDLQIQDGVPRNTFVFSEKDLPGFRPNPLGRRFGNAKDHLKKTENGRVEKRQRGARTITSKISPQCRKVHILTIY
jgi:transcription initiation factor TFIIF subunit beta